MSRERRSTLVLSGPRKDKQPTRLPTLSPHFLSSPHPCPLSPGSPSLLLHSNQPKTPSNKTKKYSSFMSDKQLFESKHSQLLSVVESERKAQDVHRMIDVRKSIKILVDYFQNQGDVQRQPMKFRNVALPRKRFHTQPDSRPTPKSTHVRKNLKRQKVEEGDLQILSLSKGKEDSQEQEAVEKLVERQRRQGGEQLVVVFNPSGRGTSSVRQKKATRKARKKAAEECRGTRMQGWQTFEQTSYIE